MILSEKYQEVCQPFCKKFLNLPYFSIYFTNKKFPNFFFPAPPYILPLIAYCSLSNLYQEPKSIFLDVQREQQVLKYRFDTYSNWEIYNLIDYYRQLNEYIKLWFYFFILVEKWGFQKIREIYEEIIIIWNNLDN